MTKIMAKRLAAPARMPWRPRRAIRRLFVFFFNSYGFQVLGLENLAAIETFDVFHAVAPGDDLGTVVLTSGLHKKQDLGFILMKRKALSRGFSLFFWFLNVKRHAQRGFWVP